MLKSRNIDQLKNNFSCDFFCEKIWRTSQFLEIFKII